MHKNGGYKPEDLQKEKEYQDLIKKTYETFNFAITDNDMPEAMSRALQSDAYLLSSLKANAQLFEASKLLLNDDGSLKSFATLSGEFDKLNIKYNQNYLDSEYQFAVSSSQSAAKWVELGSSERYNLQYRTAGDDRVRAAHRALADITLPKDDAFWQSYTPPNGFKCRCTYVEVLNDKYDVSDSQKSIAKGEAATTEIGKDGKNRLEIFRFNPGAEKVLFPPKHPYNMVKGADVVRGGSSESKPDFKGTVKELSDTVLKKGTTVKRKELNAPIAFTKSGIKEAINQPHEFIVDKNKMLLNIDKILKKAPYLGYTEDIRKNPMVAKIHIFETVINDKKTYLINREMITGEVYFYSVSDSEKVITGIKK